VQGRQRPPGDGGDRVGAPPGDLADGGRVQVRHEPQQQDLPLLLGQMGEEPDQQLTVDDPCGRHVDLTFCAAKRIRDRDEPLGWKRRDRATTAGAGGIEQAPMGDREHPRSEASLVAGEARQVTGDLEERLPQLVLRLGCAPTTQVAEQRPRQVVIQRGPGQLVPEAGLREDALEAVPDQLPTSGAPLPCCSAVRAASSV